MSDQVTQRYPILQAHFPWHKARVTFLLAFLLEARCLPDS